jgi:oxalate decarboxylase
MSFSHLFHLSTQTPQNKSEGGERIKADVAHFPLLKGMSLYKLRLYPSGFREPHWHPNADEFGYCLQGEVLVTFYHTGDNKQTFLVQKGEAFWIPSGALHTIENVGRENGELLLEFTHENPEEFHLSSSLGMFSNAVLGNTWDVSQDHFRALHRPLKDRFAVLNKTPRHIPDEARYANPYRFALEASQPSLDKESGSVRIARHNLWPILKNHSLYSLRITDVGMREPHWHPGTAELGYVHKGHARMTIMNPQGETDTYSLQPGDLYFIPKAYPHHIENIGEGPLHFLVFFDQPMPGDVGFSGSIRALPDEILGSLLHVEPPFFKKLNKVYADCFLVDKINPVDPL